MYSIVKLYAWKTGQPSELIISKWNYKQSTKYILIIKQV